MKINENVIEKYTKLCPVSTSKCQTREDIEFKIHRAITLGRVSAIKDGGNTLIVRYYELDFKVKNNRVVSMNRIKNKPAVEVDEKLKEQYNRQVQYAASAW